MNKQNFIATIKKDTFKGRNAVSIYINDNELSKAFLLPGTIGSLEAFFNELVYMQDIGYSFKFYL